MDKLTIIVADDDIELVEFYKEVLKEVGYEIHTACTGEELLRIYKDIQVDLVIMDTLDSIFNRQLNYVNVFDILRKMNPDVKILFTSGLHVDPKEFKERYQVRFLAKPFSQDALIKEVTNIFKEK